MLNGYRETLVRFHGSRMEGFLSTFPPYCGAPPVQDSSVWVKRQGCFITPQGLNYLELCKAIISQVNPGLPPPIKRALTKECGVQVNAKVDKVIQCSLGPKTLFGLEGDHRASPKSPKTPDLRTRECSTPPVSSLRFARPVSIYSPVFDRRIYPTKPSDATGSEGDPEDARRGVEEVETYRRAEDMMKDSNTTVHRPNKGSSFQVGWNHPKNPGYMKTTPQNKLETLHYRYQMQVI